MSVPHARSAVVCALISYVREGEEEVLALVLVPAMLAAWQTCETALRADRAACAIRRLSAVTAIIICATMPARRASDTHT